MPTYSEIILKQNIRKYLKSKKRTSELIEYIANLNKLQSNDNKCIKFLKKEVQKSKDAVRNLKVLTLIDRIIGTHQNINIQSLLHLFNSIKPEENNGFQSFLSQKIIKPYITYLQKRVLNANQQSSEKVESDKKIAEHDDSFYAAQCYRFLNILTKGLNFHESIFMIGRYYSPKIVFLIDFNIYLGLSIQKLYIQMKFNFQKIRQSNKTYIELIKQIEVIHESMNSIYFNIYHYRYLKPYVPTRIQTDQLYQKCQKQQNTQCRTKQKQKDLHQIEQMLSIGQNKKQLSKQQCEKYTMLAQISNVLVSTFSIDQLQCDLVQSEEYEDQSQSYEQRAYQSTQLKYKRGTSEYGTFDTNRKEKEQSQIQAIIRPFDHLQLMEETFESV